MRFNIQKLIQLTIFSAAILYFHPSNAFVRDKKAERWADSVFATLNENEKLGQLFMIAAYSNRDERHYQKIDSLIKYYHVGGLIFFQGGPMRQAILTNRYQAEAKVPLMIGIDAEWGLNMRLDSTMFFPKQMTMGAIGNIEAPRLPMEYLMGKEIALHCKRLGIHVNFAPVADVNNNAENPVIGFRSFGEDKEKVAAKAIAYMKGMQHYGIMANAKHFPGHGDTDADSHFDLPVIRHDKKRLNNIELYPFKKLMKDSLMSVMVAHIHVPSLDNRANVATTLSPKVVNDLLKNKMGFEGLIFTDALNMKGVAKYYTPGEVDVLALIAGNDVLLFAENVPIAIDKIKDALLKGKLDREDIDKRIKKILRAKYWAGLNTKSFIDTTHLYQDLNSNRSKAIRQTMYEKAMTVVKNEQNLLPFKTIDTNKFASVSIGSVAVDYKTMLDRYTSFAHFAVVDKNASPKVYDKLMDTLKNYNRIIVSLHELNNKRKDKYGIPANAIEFIRQLQAKHKVVVVHFGNAYGLKHIEFAHNLVCAYEDNVVTRAVVPQVLFGALPAEGILPVTVSLTLKANQHVVTKSIHRLKYAYPETLGYKTRRFTKLDSIVDNAIKEKAIPGATMLVVKNNTVIYQKSFGYLNYSDSIPVTENTLYDLASITKTAATTQALMFLHSWKKLDFDYKISSYLPEIQGTNKENMIINDILSHQAGLVSYIDFWKKSMKGRELNPAYYSKEKSDFYPYRVSKNLYASPILSDSIWKWTLNSPLLTANCDTGCYAYKYSDLSFHFMKKVSERLLNQPIDKFLYQNIYLPLGLHTLVFNPLEKLNNAVIAPTEDDKTFRNTTVVGTVHDQTAAMMGGIAGHAGLFGKANDLAILGQMNLNYGYYGGIKYYKHQTVDEFTRPHLINNRRGYGWDRPFFPDEVSLASENSYGHTGFTGTSWWIDPCEQLIFVFLSNRTYPNAENKKLTSLSIRTKLLNATYEAIR